MKRHNDIAVSSPGFTLVELMVVVAIIAILASISYPSYRDHVRKTVRREAVGQVLAMAQRMEKIRAQTYSYAAGVDLSETGDHYVVSVTIAEDKNSYTVSATAIEGDDQANDLCGTLVYASSGTWSFDNGKTQADCI